MTLFLLYLVKVAACITMFYLVYSAAMSKETFFKLNRIVLLSSVLLSLLFPVLTLTFTKKVIATPHIATQEVFSSDVPVQPILTLTDSGADWMSYIPFIAFAIFIVGGVAVLLKNLFGVFQIIKIINSSKKVISSGLTLYISRREVIPFSWFNKIVISDKDYSLNREIIIEHEKAHIKLKHNWDLLLINLIAVFQWFNPLFWLLRKELVTTHEYQADRSVLNNGIDAKKYQYLLISKGTQQSFSIPVVNHLCSGNFQKRIKMMLKKRSNPIKAIKVLFLIPLLAIAVAAFAKTKYEFPKSLENDFLKFAATQVNYPQDAKESGTEGVYYVQIKSEKGVVTSAAAFLTKEELNVPLLGENIIVVAYGKKEDNVAKGGKNDSALKSELVRVAGELSKFDNPEWRGGSYDFAIEVVFQLR